MSEETLIVTRDAAETHRAGELLGALALPGDVVALAGGLGAGKTALVQGMAAGLGVVGHVPSPTFNILLVHRAPVPLYHFDLYRLDSPSQLADIDFYETVEADGISAIEWADRFPGELPADRLDVVLEAKGERDRYIIARGTGPRSRALASAWADAWSEAGEGGAR
jgi:tRNA threonylcarbamoyladenosine biosynthesis protein TsaE